MRMTVGTEGSVKSLLNQLLKLTFEDLPNSSKQKVCSLLRFAI